MPSVCLIYNKSNAFGIKKDIQILRAVLGGKGYTIHEKDPLEPPVRMDIAIHIEIPQHVWMPWAQRNILIVNPEWYVSAAWDAYLPRFDAVICKDSVTKSRLEGRGCKRVVNTGWAIPSVKLPKKAAAAADVAEEFTWFLGGSMNKRPMVPIITAAWRETYPRLTIFSASPLEVTGPARENIQIIEKVLEPAQRDIVARSYKGHLGVSRGEGFGYAAAEAHQLGAYLIVTPLPCYLQAYSGAKPKSVSYLPTPMLDSDLAHVVDLSACTPEILQPALDEAMKEFAGWSPTPLTGVDEWCNFEDKFLAVLREVGEGVGRAPQLPPILDPDACPPITVVTLLYNRRRFFDLACHNIMVSDYPKDKIEWVIVEDSDDPLENASDRVQAVAEKSAPLKVVYVPLQKRETVAEKRNLGVQRASNDIILMMDDDDHYPETSFRRRVAWLTLHSWKPKVVGCTTIACYDLIRGISAVNSPPAGIPLGQRVSEATLTFYKSWWNEVKFDPEIQVGEGESFIKGHESEFLEIPPQQIIVAFTHSKNTSHRRIPSADDVKPGCFWGFPPQFLQFIHGLAGIKVVS
jgi:hypothetical protein